MSYSANLKDRIGRFVIYAIVIMLALACLLPLWNIVAISFSSSEAVSANAVGLVRSILQLQRILKLLMIHSSGVPLAYLFYVSRLPLCLT